MQRIVFFMLAAIALAAGLGEYVFSDPLRLHIVAAGDSAEEQGVKLIVRDAVLTYTAESMSSADTKQSAVVYAREHLRELEACANTALIKAGADYTAHAQLGVYDFPEKSYGRLVYPAGSYTALRIVLGEGKGQNWWCVLYPPLCVTGSRGGRKALRFYSAQLFGRLFK